MGELIPGGCGCEWLFIQLSPSVMHHGWDYVERLAADACYMTSQIGKTGEKNKKLPYRLYTPFPYSMRNPTVENYSAYIQI